MNQVPSVHELVEAQARSIRNHIRDRKDATPASLLELQIAFQLEQLDRLREVHREQLSSILHAECYVGTDLLALDGYAPKTWHYRLGARDNLKNKLLALDAERRRLLLWFEREQRDLEVRLLDLVSQRALLGSR